MNFSTITPIILFSHTSYFTPHEDTQVRIDRPTIAIDQTENTCFKTLLPLSLSIQHLLTTNLMNKTLLAIDSTDLTQLVRLSGWSEPQVVETALRALLQQWQNSTADLDRVKETHQAVMSQYDELFRRLAEN